MWQAVSGKARYKKIWLEEGVLKAGEASGVLWSLQKPELPTEFARVIDGREAIKFERRYSPLGYDFLVKDSSHRRRGDPLEWVLNQAKFVRLAIKLLDAWVAGYGDEAMHQFYEMKIERIGNLPGIRVPGELTYPCGAYDCKEIFPVPSSEAEALRAAPHFVEILVNANTEDVHQKLVAQHQGKLIWVVFFKALIEAIWSMVGDWAIKTQQGQEAGYLKKCVYCKLPFIASDKRQRFCPRPSWAGPGQSLCSLSYHQKKQRQKDISQEISSPQGGSIDIL